MTFRVLQLVISKTNNGTAVQLSLNVGTVSQMVRSGIGPYIKRTIPVQPFLRFSPSHNWDTQ
ncbi:MAG: hypothetical protein KAT01_00080, partial [Candidatus Aminicenantes bacterium]|nr:hypothetical protein [Candidatus Aminicenantes bacterium]